MIAEEGANLEGGFAAICVRTNDANVNAAGPAADRLKGKHLLSRCQPDPQPAGAIVDPCGINNVVGLYSQQLPGLFQLCGCRRAGTDKGRSGKGKSTMRVTDRDQTGTALLNDARFAFGQAVFGKPGMASAERRVSGKRHLPVQ